MFTFSQRWWQNIINEVYNHTGKSVQYLIGPNFVGPNFRRPKIFVGPNFRPLLKISSLGPTNSISGSLLKLFKNYLLNRKQRVVLNGFQSDYSIIQSGVPQGSVLGPLLFLIYINDLERNIRSNVKFFADDTKLFSIVNNPLISAIDLNIICQWAHQWKMEFNPDPTKQANEILFSCKKFSPNHPQLIFNGFVVVKVNEQKHLGLVLEPSISFEKHLCSNCRNCSM